MFTQVLQRQPVLRQRLLLPYVPLPSVGSANVPVLHMLIWSLLYCFWIADH